MGAHPAVASQHNAADLAAVLTNANSTLRNASLLTAMLHNTSPLPSMFVDQAEHDRPALGDVDDVDNASSSNRNSNFHHDRIPVVDLAPLRTRGDVGARAALVASIAAACEKFGFFQVVNHGIDQALVERCERVAHEMFELPLDVKERVHRPPGTSFGYGANTWVNQTVMHWAESFHMQLHPTSNIRKFSSKLFAEGDPSKFRYRKFPCSPQQGLL